MSEQAIEFAKILGVKVVVKKNLGVFPRIKCNVGRNGEKIFHLPFDQQYDATIIDERSGDCYAFTVDEVEKKGFRRAMKHYGLFKSYF